MFNNQSKGLVSIGKRRMGNCCFGKKHVAHDHNQVRIENAMNRLEEREIDQTLAQLNREDAAAIVYNPLVYNPHHPLVYNPDPRINYLPNTKVVGYGDRDKVTQGDFKPPDFETTMPCGRKNQFYC
jgi:hypothetical protein